MSDLPLPDDRPDQKIENADNRKQEDLWSPEFSEQQRAVMHQMVELAVGKMLDETERSEVVERITTDTLAHVGFRGLEIPTSIPFDENIQLAAGYASAVVDNPNVLNMQAGMEAKLKEIGVEVDPEAVKDLGLLGYIYKIGSWRGNDGFGREGYSETQTSRETVDKIASAVAGQEGVISADDVIAELSKTNIKVGAEKVKKGKGNKPDVRTSAWQNTTDNTQELIRMILTEVSGKLNGNLEVDEEGKPFVLIGSGGKPAERNDLEREDEVLKEDDAMLIETIILQILGDETEEALEVNPVEVGGLVSSFNLRAENFSDLSELEQAKYKNQVLDAARQVFLNIFLEENEKGLFLTVK